MKCFIAIFLLAFVAVVMAVEKTPEAGKTPEITDVDRDKRGLGYYSPYAYSSYPSYAYSAYNYPHVYTAPPYFYPYVRHHYPYYNNPYIYN